MIYYKTDEEIELLRQSNVLVGRTLAEVGRRIKPGVETLALDKCAEQFIRDNNAVPGFLDYEGFPNTLCISINEEVVHGIPSKRVLKEGDIVSIDCGVLKNDFYGDSAFSFPVGEVKKDVSQLLFETRKALEIGVQNAVENKRIGDIGNSIQSHVENCGYSVVREMVGHGIGRSLHEEPQVPNYGRRGHGIKLREGLVIAIEPMINLGKRNVYQAEDGWTIVTRDKKPSAHFEHTVVVRKRKVDVLSTFEYIDEVLNSK